MSDFSPSPPPSTPGSIALARLRFERFVFFALAAVMLIMAVAGLVEIRRGQDALVEERHRGEARAQAAEAEATRRADERRSREVARLERTLEGSRESLAGRTRELGRMHAWLAALDARGDAAARRRGLEHLADSRRLGAPAWIGLAQRLLTEPGTTLNLSGMSLDGRPGPWASFAIETAQASPDGRMLFAARRGAGLEAYRLDVPQACERIELASGAQVTALAAANRKLAVGLRGGETLLFEFNELGRLQSRRSLGAVAAGVAGLAFSPLARRLAVLDETGGLKVFALDADMGLLRAESLPEPGLCVCMAADAGDEVFALGVSGAAYRGARAFSEPAPFRVERGALSCSQGELMAVLAGEGKAWLGGWTLPELKPSASLRCEIPIVTCSFAGIEADGSALCGSASGRLTLVTRAAGASEPRQLEGEIRFVAHTLFGEVSATARGAMLLSRDDEWLRRGRTLGPAAAGVTPLGAWSGRQVWPLAAGTWLAARGEAGAFSESGPLPEPLSGVDEAGRTQTAESLVAVLWGGHALVRLRGGAGMAVITQSGTLFTLPDLPGRGAPRSAVAARAPRALLQAEGALWLIDAGLRGHQVLRGGSGMELFALDARGETAAWITERTLYAMSLADQRERPIAEISGATALALLFGGTVACVALADSLRLIELESRRTIATLPLACAEIAATDDALLYVAREDGLARLLRLTSE